jgi:hypothetical protein
MKFRLGAIPTPPDFTPDSAWKPLREPGPWVMQLCALPIGVAACLLMAWLWTTVTPLQQLVFVPAVGSTVFTTLAKAGSQVAGFIAGLILVHELIHAVVHPHGGRSPRTILGFWPSHLLFYAHYDDEMTCRRMIAILCMPFVLMSILPLAISALAGAASTAVAWVSVVNALLACGDLLAIGLVGFQVPAKAMVRNHGYETYWKPA